MASTDKEPKTTSKWPIATILPQLEAMAQRRLSIKQMAGVLGMPFTTLYNYYHNKEEVRIAIDRGYEFVNSKAVDVVLKSITDFKDVPSAWRWLETHSDLFKKVQVIEHTGAIVQQHKFEPLDEETAKRVARAYLLVSGEPIPTDG